MVSRFMGMMLLLSGVVGATCLESNVFEESRLIALAYKEEGKLAQLYADRGESYLAAKNYAQAVADFEAGYDQIVSSWGISCDDALLFRIFLGEVIAYDHLGMEAACSYAIARLSSIASDAGCHDCLEQSPCPGDSLELALERKEAAEQSGSRLQQLAQLASTSQVQQILSGLAADLTERATHCCDACAFLNECSMLLATKLEER